MVASMVAALPISSASAVITLAMWSTTKAKTVPAPPATTICAMPLLSSAKDLFRLSRLYIL